MSASDDADDAAAPDSGAARAARGRGPLAWMAQNPVAANLLMALLVLGGLLTLPGLKQEVFPEFELDLVTIQIAYPGASPSEVEQAVVLAAEEAIRGIEDIKEVRSSASEGGALITIELVTGSDPDRALSDIQGAIDRITSFPEDIERPVTSLATNRMEVISAVVHGDLDEKSLRNLGERMRDDLLALPNITQVDLAGVRPPEVSIEVPRRVLRSYGLTLQQVADVVRSASVELPGGALKTSGGELLVRTTERRRNGADFADIIVLSRPDGSQVRLGDIANIRDEFRDTDQEAYFNNERAVMVKVYRVGGQTPIDISETVQRYVAEHARELPPGVSVSTWADRSEWYAERLDLLLRNAALGLLQPS
jgi:multidrug efflux pump subunit AcrB